MFKRFIAKPLAPLTLGVNKFNEKLTNNNLMFRPFLASVFFFFSLTIFETLARRDQSLIEIFVVVYSVVLIIFFLYNILNFMYITAISSKSLSERFPMVLTINAFLGLVCQLFFLNITLATLVSTLSGFRNFGLLSCEIRCNFVRFYYDNQIYTQIGNFIWWISIFAITSFFVASYLYWFKRVK